VGGSINRIRDLFLFRLRPLFSEREIIRLIEETEEEIKRRLLEQRHPEKALNEEREAMMMRLRAVIMNAPSHPTKLVPAEISRARDGHESILIPCPQCGKPKRVFPEQTKRFRCDCGFDRPYPFS
jgi:shikimate kinase